MPNPTPTPKPAPTPAVAADADAEAEADHEHGAVADAHADSCWTAVARELLGFVRAVAVQVEREQAQRPAQPQRLAA